MLNLASRGLITREPVATTEQLGEIRYNRALALAQFYILFLASESRNPRRLSSLISVHLPVTRAA